MNAPQPPESSSAPVPPSAPTTPTAAMIRTLGLVATICGLIIVGAYQGSFSAVQENKRIALERAVFKVIPSARSIGEYFATANGVTPASGDTPPGAIRFYAGYDADGKLAGVAAEGAAKGYADVVRILFAWIPECQCVTGFGLVSSRETPGIGDKILVDRDFLANFKELDVRLNADMNALANEVKTVKHGTKTQPWQIDAISGATITSRAVGRGINEAAQALLPRVAPHLDSIRTKP
ncbi:FMN-binding protein [Rhodocyclus tenuis]|uniref:Electron transport complex protein RnfG n=1 Tax=Rhodocyclus tenuis TaxID=1066 RepID=A0A840GCS4_RHOTE|nr:FMN-binding protein [Rhodocyclus tenuis]MBB4246372.1 electron transport complex protein RnfG [Rhodocyclus tenuis]